MKIEVRAICCEKEFVAKNEVGIYKLLLIHIRHDHKNLYKRLEKRGMLNARSQNGTGYYDIDGKGWKGASAGFRTAWTEEALEIYIRKRGGIENFAKT